MIGLYGVVDEPEAALAACRKLSDDPPPETLCLIGTSRVSCVGRRCTTRDVPTDSRALVGHDAVLRRIMTVSTVVPFRYGTVLGEAEAERDLGGREEAFEDLLAWLRGRVELALRARSSAARPECSHSSGRSYLMKLRKLAADPALTGLHRALTSWSVAAVAAPDRPGGIKASYLVERADVDAFKEALEAHARAGGIEGVSLTGPWAPYSFVDRDPAAAGREKGATNGA